MKSHDTYPTDSPNPLDYEQLKAYGLEYIRNIANKQWTDFNLHDPGVTILEALCFALTDLAYRTRFGMAELLTKKGENHPRLNGTLFPAHEILQHEPVTANDYRKFILETVPGIKNVWVETPSQTITTPQIGRKEKCDIGIRGHYSFSIELEDEAYILGNSRLQDFISHDERWRYLESFGTNYKEAYKNCIRNFYLKHRNLCEDFEGVKILEPVHIGIHAEIETERHIDQQQLMEKLVEQVSEYFSPVLKYHTLAELIKKGKTPEEIYQGPLPRIGFIDSEELKQHQKKEALYISDILNILMKIEGVVSVKQLYFLINDEDLKTGNNGKPIIETKGLYSSCSEVRLMNSDYAFYFNAFDENFSPKNEIYFVNNGLTYAPWGINYNNLSREAVALPDKNIQHEFPIPEGHNRNLSTYYSFQHIFPKAYRMGLERISDSASHLHKAERLQLKAYLTFFDQLIADYLEQLASIEEYFSVDPIANGVQTDPTYFFHELNDKEIIDIRQILNPLAEGESRTDKQISADIDRRSRVMDHLLARFNVAFVDYSLLAFLISPNNSKDANQLLSNWGQLKQQFEREEIEDKKLLLGNYPILSSKRSQAIDYTEEIMLSGVERMILAQLGVNNPRYDCVPPVVRTKKKESIDEKGNKIVTVKHFFYDNRKENYNDNFGIHIIEHSLLLPYGEITEDRFLKLSREDNPGYLLDNPYSFRVTVLITGWLDICQNMNFRTFVENTIRQAFPAHVAVKICWVDPFIMWKAESTYRNFIRILKRQPVINVTQENWTNWTKEMNKGIEAMLKVFDKLRNIYPSVFLPNANGSENEFPHRLDFMHLDSWTQDFGAGEKWQEEEKNELDETVFIIEKWAFSKSKANK